MSHFFLSQKAFVFFLSFNKKKKKEKYFKYLKLEK